MDTGSVHITKTIDVLDDNRVSSDINGGSQTSRVSNIDNPERHETVTLMSSSLVRSSMSPTDDALGINGATSPENEGEQPSPSKEDHTEYAVLLASSSQPHGTPEASPVSTPYAMSPLDEAVKATLEELKIETGDPTLYFETSEQGLDTIYEEDGTFGSHMASYQSVTSSVAGNFVDDPSLPSTVPKASRSSTGLLPFPGQSSPYPVTRAPTNTPISDSNTPFAISSLPSISSLLISDFEVAWSRFDYNKEVKGSRMSSCYIRTLPPLLQLFSFVATEPIIISSRFSQGFVGSCVLKSYDEVD